MKRKAFKSVPGPFGGKDEQATQDAFVQYVGGTRRAEQLSSINSRTYPSCHPPHTRYYKTRDEIFREKAKAEGFSDEEVDAFAML